MLPSLLGLFLVTALAGRLHRGSWRHSVLGGHRLTLSQRVHPTQGTCFSSCRGRVRSEAHGGQESRAVAYKLGPVSRPRGSSEGNACLNSPSPARLPFLGQRE